jgi:hypothetical protein
VWRFTMFLVCLIAALTGSPLRQAEAARDLARSLAELEGGDVIEVVDGGVGDDAGETILTAGARTGVDHTSDLPAIDDGPCLPMSAPLAAGGEGTCSPQSTPPHTSLPGRRYACLQVFRF